MTAAAIQLDEATHTYTLNGVVVPNVTRVIDQQLRDLSKIPLDVLLNKREIGQLVHEATALDAAGQLDDATIDQDIVNYVKAWRKFLLEKQPRILATEQIVYHPLYGYVGKLDHEMVINDVPGIVDKKSGDPDDAVGVQLASYLEARNHGRPAKDKFTRRWALHLRPDGNYRLIPFTAKDDFSTFLNALSCFKWRTAHV